MAAGRLVRRSWRRPLIDPLWWRLDQCPIYDNWRDDVIDVVQTALSWVGCRIYGHATDCTYYCHQCGKYFPLQSHYRDWRLRLKRNAEIYRGWKNAPSSQQQKIKADNRGTLQAERSTQEALQ